MKILITGGAGFIGSHSADALIAAGHTARIYDNLSTGERANVSRDAELIVGDIRDFEATCAAARGMDAVLHLAALTGAPQSLAIPYESYSVNAQGAVNVFEAARRAGIKRVVFASTAALYGDLPGRKTERSAIRPLVPYSASKLMAEQAAINHARNYEMEIVRMRYFNVYGPRQKPNSGYAGVTTLFAAAIQQNKSCTVFGNGDDMTRDYVYVGDLAQANARALVYALPAESAIHPDAPRCPVYNIGSGRSASVNDVLAAFERALGRPVARTYQPARPGEVPHSATDISRAVRELGWRPLVSLQDGLKWLLEAGTLGAKDS